MILIILIVFTNIKMTLKSFARVNFRKKFRGMSIPSPSPIRLGLSATIIVLSLVGEHSFTAMMPFTVCSIERLCDTPQKREGGRDVKLLSSTIVQIHTHTHTSHVQNTWQSFPGHHLASDNHCH